VELPLPHLTFRAETNAMRSLPKLIISLCLLVTSTACTGGTSFALPFFPDNSCNSCAPAFFTGGSDRGR
jgi:hypothetical protein